MIEQFVDNLPGHMLNPKTILELGVCDGAQSVELSTRFPDARIYSFDASPRCAVDIRETIKGRDNITFNQLAVGDRDYDTVFKMCEGLEHNQKGSGSLLPLAGRFGQSKGWRQVDVPVHVTRLDTWAAANDVQSVDLIWSDLQGCDYEALIGLGSLLDTVQAVYAEVMYSPIYEGQKLFGDVDMLLAGRGFSLVGNWPLPAPHVFGDALWLRV